MYVNIRIAKTTRDLLKECGRMGETYDNLLLRLLGSPKDTPTAPQNSTYNRKQYLIEYSCEEQGKCLMSGDYVNKEVCAICEENGEKPTQEALMELHKKLKKPQSEN